MPKNDTIALEIVTTIHVDYNVDFQRWLPMLSTNVDYQCWIKNVDSQYWLPIYQSSQPKCIGQWNNQVQEMLADPS